MKSFLAFNLVLALSALFDPPTPNAKAIDPRYTQRECRGEDVTVDGSGKPLMLTGTCGKLTIEKVGKHADIVANELNASEVLIKGNIDGQSNVSVRAKGTVMIQGDIVGKSKVGVYGASKVQIRGKIDGQSRVFVACPLCDFIVNGKIDGGRSTDVNVRCRQAKIDGGVQDARVYINGQKEGRY